MFGAQGRATRCVDRSNPIRKSLVAGEVSKNWMFEALKSQSDKLPRRVTREQFTRDGARITHEPTGATFLHSQYGVVSDDWCLAGLVPGAVYDPAEIMDVARDLFDSPLP
jgi:hypothetical protein